MVEKEKFHTLSAFADQVLSSESLDFAYADALQLSQVMAPRKARIEDILKDPEGELGAPEAPETSSKRGSKRPNPSRQSPRLAKKARSEVTDSDEEEDEDAPTQDLPFDALRFRGEAAYQLYQSRFADRQFIKERGFSFDWGSNPRMREAIDLVIEALEWQTFAKAGVPPNLTMVREFYSNMFAEMDHKVLVRGVEVPCGEEAIRMYYSLKPVAECNFERMLEEANIFPAIAKYLCPEGIQWNIQHPQRPPVNFSKASLRWDARVWQQFIVSKITPTKGITSIGRRRTTMLYCILRKFPVNVAKIMHRGIFSFRKNHPKHLWYPSLITGLCLKAGVSVLEDDLVVQPGAPIGVTRLSKYQGSGSTVAVTTNAMKDDSGFWKARALHAEAEVKRLNQMANQRMMKMIADAARDAKKGRSEAHTTMECVEAKLDFIVKYVEEIHDELHPKYVLQAPSHAPQSPSVAVSSREVSNTLKEVQAEIDAEKIEDPNDQIDQEEINKINDEGQQSFEERELERREAGEVDILQGNKVGDSSVTKEEDTILVTPTTVAVVESSSITNPDETPFHTASRLPLDKDDQQDSHYSDKQGKEAFLDELVDKISLNVEKEQASFNELLEAAAGIELIPVDTSTELPPISVEIDTTSAVAPHDLKEPAKGDVPASDVAGAPESDVQGAPKLVAKHPAVKKKSSSKVAGISRSSPRLKSAKKILSEAVSLPESTPHTRMTPHKISDDSEETQEDTPIAELKCKKGKSSTVAVQVSTEMEKEIAMLRAKSLVLTKGTAKHISDISGSSKGKTKLVIPAAPKVSTKLPVKSKAKGTAKPPKVPAKPKDDYDSEEEWAKYFKDEEDYKTDEEAFKADEGTDPSDVEED